MKVFENIKKWKSEIFLVAKADCSASWNFEQELEQIFKDLTGLRKNESLTRRYFETRLRYTTHSENHLRQFLWRKEKGEIKQSQEYSAYQPLTGEVVLPERFLYPAMMEVLKDDKYSFWYVYKLIARERNHQEGRDVYQLSEVPQVVVDYAVDYDSDMLFSIYSSDKPLADKYNELSLCLCKSRQVKEQNIAILSQLKTAFEGVATQLISSIEIIMQREHWAGNNRIEHFASAEQKEWSDGAFSASGQCKSSDAPKSYFDNISDETFKQIYDLLMSETKSGVKVKDMFTFDKFNRAIRLGDISRIYVSPFKNRLLQLCLTLKDKTDNSWIQSVADSVDETVEKMSGNEGYADDGFLAKLTTLI